MGKLKELLDEYKLCPVNSPKEREIKESIDKIVVWLEENNLLTAPFKLPIKTKKLNLLQFNEENGFYNFGNFILHRVDFCHKCKIYKGLLATNNGNMVHG